MEENRNKVKSTNINVRTKTVRYVNGPLRVHRVVSVNLNKPVARRRYVRKIEKAILADPKLFYICAERMKIHGWYSTKTATTDIVFSILSHLEKLAKKREMDQYYKFKKEMVESNWLGVLNKKRKLSKVIN